MKRGAGRPITSKEAELQGPVISGPLSKIEFGFWNTDKTWTIGHSSKRKALPD